MSWYDANYTRRALVRVPAGMDVNATITLPTNWDTFWTTVQSTGYDVRFCDKSGDTLLTYERATWTYANKAGVFEILNGNQETGLDSFIFLYWGYAAAADVSTAVASPFTTAALDLMAPVSPVIDAVPDAPGASQPAVEIATTSDEVQRVTFRVDPRDLLLRREPSAGSDRLEEWYAAKVYVYDADGTTTSTSLAAAVDFAFEDSTGAQYVIVSLDSGTAGSDYILELEVYGTSYVRRKRVAVRVRDLSVT